MRQVGAHRRGAAADALVRPEHLIGGQVAVGWWPGDDRHPGAAFYAYAHPAQDGFSRADLSPGRWDDALGEYLLDWDDVRSAPDPRAVAVQFARAAFRHACAVCGWDEALAASAEGRPPPVS